MARDWSTKPGINWDLPHQRQPNSLVSLLAGAFGVETPSAAPVQIGQPQVAEEQRQRIVALETAVRRKHNEAVVARARQAKAEADLAKAQADNARITRMVDQMFEAYSWGQGEPRLRHTPPEVLDEPV